MLNDRREDIGIVVLHLPLQHRGHPLQAGTGVDAGLRQGGELALHVAIKLHENQVPDLDVAVVASGGAPQVVADSGAVIVMNLRARATRTGIPHLPEVLLRPELLNAVRGNALIVAPQLERLVILLVHRHPEALRVDAELIRKQIPSVTNGIALEVVSKAEVSEHLEQRVMTRRMPHILQIVVLPAHPQALLRGGGTPVGAYIGTQENVLELHHSRVHEEQGRVVVGDQRGGTHHFVAVTAEVGEEATAKFGRVHGARGYPVRRAGARAFPGHVNRRRRPSRSSGARARRGWSHTSRHRPRGRALPSRAREGADRRSGFGSWPFPS